MATLYCNLRTPDEKRSLTSFPWRTDVLKRQDLHRISFLTSPLVQTAYTAANNVSPFPPSPTQNSNNTHKSYDPWA